MIDIRTGSLICALMVLPLNGAFAKIITTDLPISPTDFGASSSAVQASFAPFTSYDPVLDKFSVSAPLGNDAASPGVLRAFPNTANVLASDLIGRFDMTVDIDGFGTVTGGSFSWVMSSATLGLAANTQVMTGVPILTQLHLNGGGFSFVANVDFIHPLLEQAIGPVRSMLAQTFADACAGAFFTNDPQESSCSGYASDSGPDLYFAARAFKVAEPSGFAVLALGLTGLIWLQARRRLALATIFRKS